MRSIYHALLAVMRLHYHCFATFMRSHSHRFSVCNAVCIIIRIASFNAANLSCIATCYAFVSLPHCNTLMRFYIHRYTICNAAYSSCFAIYNAACIFNDLLALMKLAFSLLWSCNAVCIIIRIAPFNATYLSCFATCYALVTLPHCEP